MVVVVDFYVDRPPDDVSINSSTSEKKNTYLLTVHSTVKCVRRSFISGFMCGNKKMLPPFLSTPNGAHFNSTTMVVCIFTIQGDRKRFIYSRQLEWGKRGFPGSVDNTLGKWMCFITSGQECTVVLIYLRQGNIILNGWVSRWKCFLLKYLFILFLILWKNQ